MKRTLALLILAAGLSGCAAVNVDRYVPAITATRLEYHRAGTMSAADVTVTNLQQHTDKVTAEKIDVQVTYPFVGTVRVTAEGYERTRNPEPAAK